MDHPIQHIFGHTPDTLQEWCAAHGMPAFRAKQILEWVYAKNTIDPAQMTNLSARDRATLADDMVFLSGRTVAHQVATDGVQKLLVEWDDPAEPALRAGSAGAPVLRAGSSEFPPSRADGLSTSEPSAVDDEHPQAAYPNPTRLTILNAGPVSPPPDPTRQTECVMIPTEGDREGRDGGGRRTACISSQVGCPVGCRFCASGLGGWDGNLSAGRIIEQVWRLGRLEGVERISNVVFMGMGEPLANFASVTAAIRTMNALWGLAISARKITISTVGLPKAIERLADEFDLPVTLALSLHAPNDEIRRTLIPWAEYTTINELLAACQKWFHKTGREITLEYTLLRSVNDAPEHARQLARLAKQLRANINLIRYNEVQGMPFGRPRTEDVVEFQRILRDANVNTHIRASRGRDIAAACGQLRHDKSSA